MVEGKKEKKTPVQKKKRYDGGKKTKRNSCTVMVEGKKRKRNVMVEGKKKRKTNSRIVMEGKKKKELPRPGIEPGTFRSSV